MFSETTAGRRLQGGLRAGRREEDTGFTKHQDGVEGCPSVKSLKPSEGGGNSPFKLLLGSKLDLFSSIQFQVHVEFFTGHMSYVNLKVGLVLNLSGLFYFGNFIYKWL